MESTEWTFSTELSHIMLVCFPVYITFHRLSIESLCLQVRCSRMQKVVGPDFNKSGKCFGTVLEWLMFNDAQSFFASTCDVEVSICLISPYLMICLMMYKWCRYREYQYFLTVWNLVTKLKAMWVYCLILPFNDLFDDVEVISIPWVSVFPYSLAFGM